MLKQKFWNPYSTLGTVLKVFWCVLLPACYGREFYDDTKPRPGGKGIRKFVLTFAKKSLKFCVTVCFTTTGGNWGNENLQQGRARPGLGDRPFLIRSLTKVDFPPEYLSKVDWLSLNICLLRNPGRSFLSELLINFTVPFTCIICFGKSTPISM